MVTDEVGNAQLDQRMTTWTIEQMLGDRLDGWMVIGIDIGGGEHDHDLRVIAVPQDSLPEGGGVLPECASRNGGEIPATSFLVHDFNPYEFLKAITHMFELRLVCARSRTSRSGSCPRPTYRSWTRGRTIGGPSWWSGSPVQ